MSDAGAALMGGMGFAPSADIGDGRAVFQPCHGTAPDIAGSGKANPTAMFLSAALMLDWLGLEPLLDLDLRLGEGTGAAFGISLAEAACKILSEMATFSEAGVSEKELE